MKQRFTILILAAVALAIPSLVCADVGDTLNTAKYKYLMEIRFPGYTGPTTLNNIPLLLILGPGLPGVEYAQFKTNAEDLRFADSDGLELAYEIDDWNTSGSSYVWVRVAALSSSGTTITAYWGNPSDTAPAYTTDGRTWDNGFTAVWHMGEPDIVDTTTNANHGVENGNTTAAGLVGDSQNFDGSQHVDITSIRDDISLDALSMSMLVRTTTGHGAEGDGGTLIAYSRSGTSPILQLLVGLPSGASAGEPSIQLKSGLGTYRFPSGVPINDDGEWHQVDYVQDAGTGTMYVDGQSRTNHSRSFSFSTSDAWTLGASLKTVGPEVHLVGDLDEVRIASAVRSDDWIKASYQTAVQNATFTEYGELQFTPEIGSVFFGW